ncbi:MAG: HD domain-containing protein [Deltaproteobacteria bacterium]|nr:HD domain-containing protein [Deltaproteobacteria bacterium]
MARSPSYGVISSHLKALSEAKKLLRALAQTSSIKKINDALGKDSELCLVGGTVRDVILGVDKCDLDLASKLHPQAARERLENAAIKVVDTGIKHGTITAVMQDGNVEITTFRKPGARESSEFSDSIEEDLGGRDFAINAIAYRIDSDALIDPSEGYKDLAGGTLKAVGDPAARFEEDPLRILRMIRFGPAQARKVDAGTLQAAIERRELLKNVSIERVRMELEKILLSPFAGHAVREMRAAGLIELIIPELTESYDFEQNRFHIEDVFEHTLTVLDNAPQTLRLRLAALLHDIGKPRSLSIDETGTRRFYNHERISAEMSKVILKRLRFSNDDIEAVCDLVRLHMRPIDCGPPGVRRLMRDLGDNFEDWREIKIADYPPIMEMEEFKERLAQFDRMVESERERLARSGGSTLAVDGNDLIALGIKPGPALGRILKALESVVIEDPELNVKDLLLERAKELISSFEN